MTVKWWLCILRPRDRTCISHIFCNADRFFTSEPPRKPHILRPRPSKCFLNVLKLCYLSCAFFFYFIWIDITSRKLDWSRLWISDVDISSYIPLCWRIKSPQLPPGLQGSTGMMVAGHCSWFRQFNKYQLLQTFPPLCEEHLVLTQSQQTQVTVSFTLEQLITC